jgi:hypothetical protein
MGELRPSSRYSTAGRPRWHQAIQHLGMPERRRIVAQVRRLVPKNQGLRSTQDSRRDATIC